MKHVVGLHDCMYQLSGFVVRLCKWSEPASSVFVYCADASDLSPLRIMVESCRLNCFKLFVSLQVSV